MICMIRMDDRLLHGQVAYAWKATIGYNAVVIASDSASKDEIKRMAIKMCCPEDVKLAIRSVDDALKLLSNPKLKPLKVLVVMDNTSDLQRLCERLNEKPLINLGGLTRTKDTKELVKAVNLTTKDIENLDKVLEMGFEIECRQVPSYNAVLYKNARNKIK